MAEKLTRLTQKIEKQLYIVVESYTTYISRFMRPVRKLLDTTSYYKYIHPYEIKPANVAV